MARYLGRKGVMYLAANGTGNAVNFGNLTKWSISFTRDRVDVTACNDTNKQALAGLPDVSGSFTAWYDDSATAALFTAANSADGTKLYLYPSADAPSKYLYGPAWVDVSSFEVAVDGGVSISGNISANGAWGTSNI